VIVVDASVVIEVLLRTPACAIAEARIFTPRQTLHAPHVIDLEIAQVLRRYALTGQVQPQRCAIALEDWQGFRIQRYAHDLLLGRIWRLRANMTAYDAAYVALAEGLAAPLVTRDARLAAAPGHRAQIDVL
jgi:predicted nucleic acid-binding protein